jgi:hypothetical protein
MIAIPRRSTVNLGDPVNREHPLNRGRVVWLYTPKNAYRSNTWIDLMGVSNRKAGNNGTLTSGPTWTPTARGDSGLLFNGTTQYVLSNTAPSVADYRQCTLAAWVKITAAPPSNDGQIISVARTDIANQYLRMELLQTTGRPQLFLRNSTIDACNGSVNPSLNVWHRFVGVADGTTLRIYMDGVEQANAPITSTSPGPNGFSVGALYQNGGPALFFPGAIADPSIWNRGLSTADVIADLELSQRGYPGVLNRTPQKWFVGTGSGGGTPFTKSLSGSTTMSGALTKAVSKSFTGSKSTSAALAKALAKTLTGTITNTATLGKLTAKPLAGSQSATGGLTKKTSKSLAGSEAVAGGLTRATGKSFSASQGSSGSLAKLRSVLASFSGVVSLSGLLLRSAAKGLTGSQSTSAALTKATAKSFAASQSTSASFSALKVILSFLSGTMATAGAIAKSVAKPFAGSQSSGGSLTKTTSKAFSASQSTSGSFTAQRVILAAFSGTLTAAGSLTRAMARAFAGAVSLVGAFTHSGGSVPKAVNRREFPGAVIRRREFPGTICRRKEF